MPELSPSDREDLRILQKLLGAIGAFLHWLIADSPFLARNVLGLFAEVLPVVSRRLERAFHALGLVESTQSRVWKRLNDAGLTGSALRLKVGIWERIASRLSEPRARTGAVAGRDLGPLFDFLRSILDSLATVFPWLELVKEFVDCAKLGTNDDVEGDPPPRRVLDFENF